MDKIPPGKKGIARLWAALLYSLNGLKYAVTKETAFQQEVCIYIVLLVVLYFLPLSITFKCILFFANTLVLIVELLNSAIEAVVDMTSHEYNERARRAKDMGSAAVLVSIVLAIALWLYAVVLVMKGGLERGKTSRPCPYKIRISFRKGMARHAPTKTISARHIYSSEAPIFNRNLLLYLLPLLYGQIIRLRLMKI